MIQRAVERISVHMLQPREVRFGIGRAPPLIPTPRVVFKYFRSPVIKPERRICKNAIELLNLAVVDEDGIADRILPDDLELLCAMEEQIHTRNCRRGKVLLLSIDLAVRSFFVIHTSDGFDQHSTSSAGRIYQDVIFDTIPAHRKSPETVWFQGFSAFWGVSARG